MDGETAFLFLRGLLRGLGLVVEKGSGVGLPDPPLRYSRLEPR